MIDTSNNIKVYPSLEAAYMGIGSRCGSPDVAVYSRERIIKVIMIDEYLGYEDAVSYYEHNILGAYYGDQTPIILD